jgi:hypothetical protein
MIEALGEFPLIRFGSDDILNTTELTTVKAILIYNRTSSFQIRLWFTSFRTATMFTDFNMVNAKVIEEL